MTASRKKAEEIRQRRSLVLQRMIEGRRVSEFMDEVLSKFNTSEKTVKNDWWVIKQELKKQRNEIVNYLVDSHIDKYEFLYRIFTEELGDDGLALKALEQKEKLLGFFKDVLRFDVEKNEFIFDVKDNTQEKPITELEDEYILSQRESIINLSGVKHKDKFKILTLLGFSEDQYKFDDYRFIKSRAFFTRLDKSICEDNFFSFFCKAFQVLHPGENFSENWHHKEICDEMQKILERIMSNKPRENDVIINLPFRATKSVLCTVCFQAWAWIKYPKFKLITVSYSESLSLEHSQLTKDLINSFWYQDNWGHIFQFRKDQNQKGFYKNTEGGYRKAVGTGGQITGSGADMIILDDPQNPAKAASEVERENTINFYKNTLYSRLNQPEIGVRFIIQQRLHDKDLSGYLLEERPEDHLHINIPGELTEKTRPLVSPSRLIEKYKDGLFWFTRFSRKVLNSFKKSLGSTGYANQVLQLSSPEEGGIIKEKWFKIIKPEDIKRDVYYDPIHFILDTAYTEKQENDATAIGSMFKKGNILYITRVEEKFLEFPDLIEFIKDYTKSYGYTNQSRVKIEPKASGKDIVSYLRKNSKLNVSECVPPTDDKTTRLTAVSPIVEAGRVVLIEGTWNKSFIENVTKFPNAARDDMVDVLIHGINEILDEGWGVKSL